MNYYHCHFELKEPQPWSEILVTYLGELNFESFQNEGNTLDAYHTPRSSRRRNGASKSRPPAVAPNHRKT